jgi:hypothetical protein
VRISAEIWSIIGRGARDLESIVKSLILILKNELEYFLIGNVLYVAVMR